MVAPVRLSVARGWFPQLSASSPRAVGHMAVATRRLSCSAPPCRLGDGLVCPLSASPRHAVGQDEQPFSLVACPNFRRSEQASRISVTHAVQASANGIESASKVPRYIFEKEHGRLIALNRINHAEPKLASITCQTCSLAGVGEVGAGVSGGEHVKLDAFHESAEVCITEGSHVRPDRRFRKGAFFNMPGKDRGRIGFPFHVADRTEQTWTGEFEAEVKAAAAGEHAEGT